MKKSIFFPVILAFIFSACSFYNIKSQETTLDYYPPKQSKDDVAYLEKIEKPFMVIGHVTANVERHQNFNSIIDKLRTEAAILGGDAITNITTDTGKGKWAQIKPKPIFENSNVRINYNADVIVFEPPAIQIK